MVFADRLIRWVIGRIVGKGDEGARGAFIVLFKKFQVQPGRPFPLFINPAGETLPAAKLLRAFPVGLLTEHSAVTAPFYIR